MIFVVNIVKDAIDELFETEGIEMVKGILIRIIYLKNMKIVKKS